jgi:hypothetical protein
MQTVREIPAARKPAKAFYAHLYDQAGALAKVDGTIYFMTDAGALTAIEPEMCTFLTVLGEIGLADTQNIMDRMHGGCAWIATHRAQGVA